ncbi:N-acyl-D-amino-acid deacylase family protein [Henriciella aquimarina]|uniref:N-acyl-D-amino-acid deacylase family protein n=1 Tax=Henriciella aquimarina TaxID=545261 RepID=UPI000A05905E|nr:D-aminoacylase [Henriciella aquimarina]
MNVARAILPASLLLAVSCQSVEPAETYDVLIENAVIYDGLGGPGRAGDVALREGRIAFVGDDAPGRARDVIDADGLAVAPGFINLLSWSNEALLYDGFGESALRQGVTLEVMGEGVSMGPLTDTMAEDMAAAQGSIAYDVSWRSLGGYLDTLEESGIAINVASYAGAATIRMNVLGKADVDPTAEELDEMKALLREAMEEGAMGVASSLIYPPGAYAETGELIALTRQAGQCGGIYATHLRSEGDRFLESVDEALTIGRETGTPIHFFHLKVGGEQNFPKMADALGAIDAARADGMTVTADMYLYNASGTTLGASVPPWVQAGGTEAMIERLQDDEIRARVIAEMRDPDADWENVMALAGGPENVMLVVASKETLKPLIGMRIDEIAALWGVSPEDAVLDLLIKEEGRPEAIYFTMSEDNLLEVMRKPYVSFASDAVAMAPRGAFLESGMHPRSYGNFARVFAHYVREEDVMSVAEAVRRMTSLPAGVLSLEDRGVLAEGYRADLVIFDPQTMQDHATYIEPHQFSTGVDTVFVNGVAALRDGEPTGALPGRAIRGRGWLGHEDGGCRASVRSWDETGPVAGASSSKTTEPGGGDSAGAGTSADR